MCKNVSYCATSVNCRKTALNYTEIFFTHLVVLLKLKFTVYHSVIVHSCNFSQPAPATMAVACHKIKPFLWIHVVCNLVVGLEQQSQLSGLGITAGNRSRMLAYNQEDFTTTALNSDPSDHFTKHLPQPFSTTFSS